jgi:tetratricopeptide (TPR) repeat protein
VDSQTLFREGIAAIRDEKNAEKGRTLLMQSLRLNPNNESGWLWLSTTINNPQKKLECIEQVLRINPTNEQALAIKKRLANRTSDSASPAKAATATPPDKAMPSPKAAAPARVPAKAATPPPVKSSASNLSSADERRLKEYLDKAQAAIDEMDDPEGAIENWVRVLEIQPDHEVALANAVRHLSRLKYMDDAKELVWNAINHGTTHPSVYLTAIDILKRERNFDEADSMREKLIQLDEADDGLIATTLDYFVQQNHLERAQALLEPVLEKRPNSQQLLLKMGELLDLQNRKRESFQYYERASKLGGKGEVAKVASKKMDEYVPGLSDKERSSIWHAVREAGGFGIFFLFLAWQDAGLDLLHIGISRLIGIIVGLLGGYLLITATSSPQQKPLAKMLGGKVPPPPEEHDEHETVTDAVAAISEIPIIPPIPRIVIGLIGAAMVVGAFFIVFNVAINLITHFQPPPMKSFDEFVKLIRRGG